MSFPAGRLNSSGVVTLKIPLLNADMRERLLLVDSRFSIRKIESEEKFLWASNPAALAISPANLIARITCAIEVKYSQNSLDRSHLEEDLHSFLSLLQLNVNEVIFATFAEETIASPAGNKKSDVFYLPGLPVPPPKPLQRVNLALDPRQWDSAWAKVTRRTKPYLALKYALSRWTLAMSRIYTEDAIVDCWIALEALFSANDQELTHRTTRDIVSFFRKAMPTLDSIHAASLLEQSYKLRSRLIHGEIPANDIETVKVAADTIRLVREIVLEFLKTPLEMFEEYMATH